MEKSKPIKNCHYQQLQNLHFDGHDQNVDERFEKGSLNIESGPNVGIVDGNYKYTSDNHLDSTIEDDKYVKNDLPTSKRLFTLQDKDCTKAKKNSIIQHGTNEKGAHRSREASYDFFEEANTNSWKKKAQVEKEIDKKGKYLEFDIACDIVSSQSVRSCQESCDVEIGGTSLGLKYETCTNIFSNPSLPKNLEEISQNSMFDSNNQETKFYQIGKSTNVTPTTLDVESNASKNIFANEQSQNASTSSNFEASNVKEDKSHFSNINLEAQHPPNKIDCKKNPKGKFNDDEEDPFHDVNLHEDIKVTNCTWSVYCEWIVLIILVSGLIFGIIDLRLRVFKLWGLELWKWMILVVIMVCGRLLSNWVTQIIIYLIERRFLLRKKVLYFVYALKGDVRNCIWLTFVLLTWNTLFNVDLQDRTNILTYVSKVLQCFLIATTLIVVKTFFVKVLASSFHMDTYFERIRDSLFNQYVLETLSGPPLHKFQVNFQNNSTNLNKGNNALHSNKILESNANKTNDEGNNSFRKKDGVVIDIQRSNKTSQTNTSTWSMKKLINLVKYYEFTTLMENFDRDILNDDSIFEIETTTEYKAKVAAKRIFRNVVKHGCKFITYEDLLRFMNKDEASRTILLFDGTLESKIISAKAFKEYVINVYKERRALASSLSDTKTAVNKLHNIINIFLSLFVIILWLLILGIATTKFIVFILSQLLVVVFIFGNTCRNTFEAIIFLFIVHPFDVGDRCVIDGNQLVVEEMNILTTVFLGELNAKIWYPNSILATKPIQNFYRSPDMSESFEFFVHSSTSAEKIAQFKDMISKYILTNPQHWKSTFNLLILDLDNAGKMKLSLNLTHTMNYQNFNEKVSRRSDLLWEIKKHLESLDIEYHLPTLKVHIQNLNTSSSTSLL